MAATPGAITPQTWPRWLRAIGLGNRPQFAWAMYDWGNSAFATTILAAVFPVYFAAIAAPALGGGNEPTVAYAYISTISLLIMAVSGPVLGSIADFAGIRKRILGVFTFIGAVASSSLFLVTSGDWVLAAVLFVIANIGFGGATIFYDSLLPHVATQEQQDRVSTAGYALGYLGGGLLLVINVAWILQPQLFGMGDTATATRWALFSVGLWWAAFSVPLFRYVREPKPRFEAGEAPVGNPVSAGFGRLWRTFQRIRTYRNVLLFLLAFWLYNDGINTIIRMATIYGAEVGIGTTDLILALVVTQFVGMPAAFAFGPLAGRIGAKNAIYLALGVYTLISIGGFFLQTAWQFYALAITVALVQGGSQAISRSLFSSLVPSAQSSEFFGFFSLSSKFAGILGPLIFAVVSQAMGTSRLSIIALLVFFIGGMILLKFVNVEEGRRIAREEDARLVAAEATA